MFPKLYPFVCSCSCSSVYAYVINFTKECLKMKKHHKRWHDPRLSSMENNMKIILTIMLYAMN